MAFLGQEYNAQELPKGRDFSPIPAGWYTASISSAELKQTKAGNGEYIAIKYDITGPTYQGRVIYGNLNIKNPNPKAEEIGRQQLGELMRAIGLAKVTDTDQLIGGNLSVKVVIKKSKVTDADQLICSKSDENLDYNDIIGFKSLSGALPTTADGAAPKKSTAPWAK
jgi:Protein of unknown function (DUF669)